MKKVLTKLVADKLLSQDALDTFVFPVVPRTEEEFLKPFMTGELSGDWVAFIVQLRKGFPLIMRPIRNTAMRSNRQRITPGLFEVSVRLPCGRIYFGMVLSR
jgi:hypothetical protein